MYKNIVPELVSFDTSLAGIKGFEMCQDFNFFSAAQEKNRFHYNVVLGDDAEIPADYDFRSEYFIKKDDIWHFGRKIFFWKPKFKYDAKNRAFYFSKDYARLPFRLGGMFIIGEHLSNIIELDLFLNGFIILRGIAAQIGGKNIGISAPGFNGKTTWLKKALRQEAKYIAEDYLIINLAEKKVYPSCPLLEENFWQRRKIDDEMKRLLNEDVVLKTSAPLNQLYLIQNSQNLSYKAQNRDFADFVLLNSLHFLNSLFIRSIIFDQGLTGEVFERISNLKQADIDYKFIEIKNFNFNFL